MTPIAARRTVLAFALALALPALVSAQPAPASRTAGTVRLLIKFRPSVHARSARIAVERAGAHQVRSIPQLGVRVLSVPRAHAGDVLRTLRSTSGVAYAERDGSVRIADTLPNDPWWPNEGSLPHVNAPQAWDLTRGSPEVVIAVLDTGVDPAQPDLQGSFVPGYDFVNNDANPSDDQGHGTQAAGVAAARSNNLVGVASYCWSCSIMPVKVMDSTGSGSMATVAAGITWAVDHGARVISMSLAGSAGYSTLQSAVQYAHDKGAVLVAAAGNYGSTSPMYPAAYPQVLSVAGSNPDDTLNVNSDYGSWVKLAAPWCNWTTARGGLYGTYCGTSSATPAVAGMAGLAFSLSPGATNAQVERALETEAAPLAGGRLVQYGRADALATLLALGAPPAGIAPASSSAPAISGTPVAGQAVNSSPGAWTGSAPMSYAYRWLRCDSSGGNCSDIGGAAGQSYSVATGDVGSTLRVAVTASNGYGSSSAVSAPTSVVQPAPPPPPPGTTSSTFSGTLNKKQTSRSFSLTVGAGQAVAALQFSRVSALTVQVQSASGSLVGSASGPSVLTLTASLPAGTYTYLVSGSGSVSFTLAVSYAAP